MSERTWSGWNDQTSRPPAQSLDNCYQNPSPPQMPYAQPAVQVIHPFYGTYGPTPIIAELPAPLPAAPPTTTPKKQLAEDEQLARQLSISDQHLIEDERFAKRLQFLEVPETGSKSNNNVKQRPVSMVLPSEQWAPSLAQQRSSHSLRPHSQSIPFDSSPSPGLAQQRSTHSLRPHSQSLPGVPWSPDSFGPLRQTQSRYSSLPEVVPDQPLKLPPPPLGSRLPPAAVSNLPEVVMGFTPQNMDIPLSPVDLGAYLEKHRRVPYPPQWKLDPVIKRYHAREGMTPKETWLDTPQKSTWLCVRRSDESFSSSPAFFTFAFKRSGGSYRDPRFSWAMQINDANTQARKRQPVWSYELRLDLKSGIRKSEILNTGGNANILPTYIHAANYDSLRFVGNDGRNYLWVSHMPLSSSDGSRYDIIRHALFVAKGNNPDPLYGDIVADHTFWDGFDGDTRVHLESACLNCRAQPIVGQRWSCKTCLNHDMCGICHAAGTQSPVGPNCELSLTCLPDETICIRSPMVDHSLVVASLQVLKDWEKHELRRQKSQNPESFMHSEEAARQHDLGRLSYWRGSDVRARVGRAPQRIQSMSETSEAMQNPNGIGGALGNLADAGLAMAARGQQGGYGGHHGGHHTYGGDGGGGGGDGGGGG